MLTDWHKIRPECLISPKERPPQPKSLAPQEEGRPADMRRDGAPTAVLAKVRA